MLIILTYPKGRRIEGILLAAGPDHMRIVVRRLNETIELHRNHGQWTDPQGLPVEVDGWVTDGRAASAEFAANLGRRASTAGS